MRCESITDHVTMARDALGSPGGYTGGRVLTPDRSETPATGLCSIGIDTRGPVTEAALIHCRAGIRWMLDVA